MSSEFEYSNAVGYNGQPGTKWSMPGQLDSYDVGWNVRAEHLNDPKALCLGYAAALLRGAVLTPQQLDELSGFLLLTRYANVVVDYDADGGFAFRPHDPRIDAPEALVRRSAA